MNGTELTFQDIVKEYPGVTALNHITFSAYPGEVLGLMGENGAGKSTLLKILGGDQPATEGGILLNGKPCSFSSPSDSLSYGISILHQERHIVPYLSVAENIFVSQIPHKAGFVKKPEMMQKTQALIDEFGLEMEPGTRVGALSLAMQQMVEIMKDYNRGQIKVMAFDEPTASLSDKEIEILFGIIRKLKAQGVTIIYVSHRMKEIFEITDRVVVLKDGGYSGESETTNITEDGLIKLMVGRGSGDIYPKRLVKHGKVVVEAKNISTDHIKDISFQLHQGEVLGFSGLVGAGRTETARAIFGEDRLISGELLVDGNAVHYKHPMDAIKDGIAYCPEDRKNEGLVIIDSVSNNITTVIRKRLARFSFRQTRKEQEVSQSFSDMLQIKTPSLDQKVQFLSGGNQQKVVVAKWLATNPKVLILDEPTRGIDIGAKAEIYEIINQLTQKNIAVILISSELPEVLGLSDRIIVMSQGQITAQLDGSEATEELVMSYAIHKDRSVKL